MAASNLTRRRRRHGCRGCTAAMPSAKVAIMHCVRVLACLAIGTSCYTRPAVGDEDAPATDGDDTTASATMGEGTLTTSATTTPTTTVSSDTTPPTTTVS